MNTGPVSITTLIGNFSLVVSVLVCYILWQERVGIFDLLGLLLLLLGIVLATYKRGGEAFGRKWKIFVVIFLLLSAAIGIVFKAFSKTDSSDAAGDMMLVSSFVMMVCYGAMYLAVKGRRTAEEKSRAGKHHIGSSGLRSFVACALLSGLLSCLYNRFNIYLSGALDAVIFFPSFNGGVIFTSALLGVLCLGERLSRSQLTGILCGILGIILIGIF
jgi:drug/metabolite transporter (DMT)-like permease